MINLRSIFFLIGLLLSVLSITMLIPLGVELFIYKTKVWEDFTLSIFISGFFGSILVLANRPHKKNTLGMREAFLITTLSWIILSIFAGLPFYYTDAETSFIDSCFEAVSSITTTGATTFSNIEDLSKGILLWRALLQWLGGTGIIVMAMVILPTLRIGGMQLFRSEFSDRSEKILPRVSQIAAAILTAYSIMTLLCIFMLYWADMPLFDAICHAMSTVSTGGASTQETSIASYNSPLIEAILIFFMILGGSTLILYIRLWNGDTKALFQDSQLHAYLGFLITAIIIITAWQWFANKIDFLSSLRYSAFTVTSLITTTGFSNTNYLYWGNLPLMLFFILSMVGGCTGSTSGGIKIFRFQILFTLTRAHLKQIKRPHGIYIPLYQKQKISDSVAVSVFTFLTLYCFCLMILALVLSATGLDFLTSLSGAAASLGNIGPGLSHLIGPYGSYMELSDFSKITMMVGMILGRLELLTVFVLFMPSFWRD